jgi:hypothetical protein
MLFKQVQSIKSKLASPTEVEHFVNAVYQGIESLKSEWKNLHYYFRNLPAQESFLPMVSLHRPWNDLQCKTDEFRTHMQDMKHEHSDGFLGQESKHFKWRQLRPNYAKTSTPYCHILTPECLIFLDTKVDIDSIFSFKKCCIEHERLMNTWFWLLNQFDQRAMQYYFKPGNIIASIRHGTFIPWDSDADVAIAPKDFVQLQSIISENQVLHQAFEAMKKSAVWDHRVHIVQGHAFVPDKSIAEFSNAKTRADKDRVRHMWWIFFSDHDDPNRMDSHVEVWLSTNSDSLQQGTRCAVYGISFSGCMAKYEAYMQQEKFDKWRTEYKFHSSWSQWGQQ